MRDWINIAKAGTPVVALVTEKFLEQSVFVSQSLGLPNLPRVLLPHPVAGSTDKEMNKIAFSVVPKIITALEGTIEK